MEPRLSTADKSDSSVQAPLQKYAAETPATNVTALVTFCKTEPNKCSSLAVLPCRSRKKRGADRGHPTFLPQYDPMRCNKLVLSSFCYSTVTGAPAFAIVAVSNRRIIAFAFSRISYRVWKHRNANFPISSFSCSDMTIHRFSS
jgi:hypothetical protein